MHFQIALTSEHVTCLGLCPVSLKVAGEKRRQKIEKEDKMAVKPKSTDYCVGRPN